MFKIQFQNSSELALLSLYVRIQSKPNKLFRNTETLRLTNKPIKKLVGGGGDAPSSFIVLALVFLTLLP